MAHIVSLGLVLRVVVGNSKTFIVDRVGGHVSRRKLEVTLTGRPLASSKVSLNLGSLIVGIGSLGRWPLVGSKVHLRRWWPLNIHISLLVSVIGGRPLVPLRLRSLYVCSVSGHRWPVAKVVWDRGSLTVSNWPTAWSRPRLVSIGHWWPLIPTEGSVTSI